MIFRRVLCGLLIGFGFSGGAFGERLGNPEDQAIELFPDSGPTSSLQPEIDQDFGPEEVDEEDPPTEDSGILNKFERAMWARRQLQKGKPGEATEEQLFQFAERVVVTVFLKGSERQKRDLVDSAFAEEFEQVWNRRHNPMRAAFFEPELWTKFKLWTYKLTSSGFSVYVGWQQFSSVAQAEGGWQRASTIMASLSPRDVTKVIGADLPSGLLIADGVQVVRDMSRDGASLYRPSLETLAGVFLASGVQQADAALARRAEGQGGLFLPAIALASFAASQYFGFPTPPGFAEMQLGAAAWSTLRVIPDILSWGSDVYRFSYHRKNPMTVLRTVVGESFDAMAKRERIPS